jgi:cell surface protein SprA
LQPDTQKQINFKVSLLFVDDFEGSQSTIDMKPFAWAWPLHQIEMSSRYDFNGSANDLSYGFKSKMAWYSIDPIFYSKTCRGFYG